MTITAPDRQGWTGWTLSTPGGDNQRKNTPQNPKFDDFPQERRFVPRQGGWTCPPCPPLRHWMSTLRDRGITANVDNGTVHLDGPDIDSRDIAWLTRHHDALLVAANGTHFDWWAGVTTGNHQPDIDLPDIGCAVAGCPCDTRHYSHDGIPFCHNHNPDWWYAR